jgi:hypothetical protein
MTNNLSNQTRTLTIMSTLVGINPIEQPINARQPYSNRILSGRPLEVPIGSLNELVTLEQYKGQSERTCIRCIRCATSCLDRTLTIRMANNDQLRKGYFDSVFKLNTRIIVEETGQIFQQENYIIGGDESKIELVIEKRIYSCNKTLKMMWLPLVTV